MSTIFFTTFPPPSGTAGPEVVGWPPTRSGCDAPEISGTSVRHREPGLANNETGYGSICKPPPEWRPSGGGRGLVTADRGLEPSSRDRKSTRLNSSHGYISYAVFCLKKKTTKTLKGSTTDSTGHA